MEVGGKVYRVNGELECVEWVKGTCMAGVHGRKGGGGGGIENYSTE